MGSRPDSGADQRGSGVVSGDGRRARVYVRKRWSGTASSYFSSTVWMVVFDRVRLGDRNLELLFKMGGSSRCLLPPIQGLAFQLLFVLSNEAPPISGGLNHYEFALLSRVNKK